MRRLTQLALIATMAAWGSQTPARADTVTWNPSAVGLNGAAFSADSFTLGDYALIQFGANATFLDIGLMPILGFSTNGNDATPLGYGTNWGAYLSYQAAGSQQFDANGVPTSAVFSQLIYTVYGYNGAATFSTSANGLPNVISSTAVPLFDGSSGSNTGSLGFVFDLDHPTGLTIAGDVTTSAQVSVSAFSAEKFATLDVDFIHPPSEYVEWLSYGQIRIPGGGSSSTAFITTQGGNGSSAAFANVGGSPVDLPEPSSGLVLPAFLLGFAALRARRRS